MPRSTLPVVLFVLVPALLAACDPAGTRTPSATKPVHCTVIVDGPKKAETANQVFGRARFRCGAPGAQQLTLKIRIEERVGTDKWKAVATKIVTLSGSATVAAELKYQSREATMGCREGSFRTVVDWSRTSRGNSEGDNLVSGAVKNPCKSLFG
jgi:hypothetical protein